MIPARSRSKERCSRPPAPCLIIPRVSAPRVELWDPSPEGDWILEHLRREGLDVRSIPLTDVVLTRGDLVVMAADVEGALPALKLLRDEGLCGDVPVILLGVPEGLVHHGDGPAFGADAVYARPVVLDALVRGVRRLLADSGPAARSMVTAPPERTLQLPDDERQQGGAADGPSSSQVFPLRGGELAWRPREPTLQLRDGPIPASSVVARSAGSSIPPRTSASTRTPTGTGSRPGTGPVAAEVPEPLIPPAERAQLSPWLQDLLHAADRRVFPDRPPLVLHFAAAQQPPDVLVPAEVLELAPFRIDEPVVDDPIGAFTYVGGPAVPPVALASNPEELALDLDTPREQRETSPETPARVARQPRHEATTGVESPASVGRRRAEGGSASPAWPDDDALLGRATPENGGRRGTLGRGGALRLLWRIAALGIDGTLTVTCAGGPTVRMTFLAGELRAFAGPVAQLALEALRTRGRAVEAPADEAGADAVLQRRVEAGELGRFERDRLLREAHQRLLEQLVRSADATFVLRRLEDTEPGRLLHGARVLGRPLRAALVEAARSLSTEEVLALVGPDPVGVAFGPDREVGLGPAELPFELCELLLRLEGRPLTQLLAAAPTEPGLAGVLYALVAGDVLVLTEAPADARPPDEVRASVRALVESAAALACDADYFAILGVGRDATQRDIERAHGSRREELAAIPLALLGLSTLEEARREALEALDEALTALGDAARRAAYAAALGPRHLAAGGPSQ